jgi:hypothetical protein
LQAQANHTFGFEDWSWSGGEFHSFLEPGRRGAERQTTAATGPRRLRPASRREKGKTRPLKPA